MFQESSQPSVYTKLSCFLPWIAKESDMEFSETVEDELKECSTGSGDINDFDVKECRTFSRKEELCIFPYYWNGKLFNECSLFEEEEFLLPAFQCPTRNITRKINGVNSFLYSDFVKQVFILYIHILN